MKVAQVIMDDLEDRLSNEKVSEFGHYIGIVLGVLRFRRMVTSISNSTAAIALLDIGNLNIFLVGRSRDPWNVLHFPYYFFFRQQVCEEIL